MPVACCVNESAFALTMILDIPKGENILYELDNFDSMQIGLASPELIRTWSHGEVKKPETINYRTLKPERDGLFCERIFGPMKDWECHCGRYKRVRYKGMVCDKCGVEVTRAKVRRERMGHIELAAPVSHIWYFRGAPSRMRQLLDIKANDLEKVLYFASNVVVDPGDTPLEYKHIFESDREYRDALSKYGDRFRAEMGAAAIKELLASLDLTALAEELRKEIQSTSSQKRIAATKRLEVVEAFLKSGNRPEWMILDVLPVIPPDLRPMVQLDGGRFATSDLNDLYRRVINRNNRLRRLLDLKAPDIIVRNEKRMLQEAVDALIDNGRRARAVTGPGNRPLKSLSELLRGKQGRFRMNLLGKRVDYSGRSVIVVGPELEMSQCGLPKEMALELFKPFVIKKLTERGLAHNIKSAKRMVERVRAEVWDVLEEVIKEHPVLLNRAPTLHRLGIQAFEPVLVEGRAIKLHPLVCTAFNADFDGDQMAVHVPLSVEAQSEARFLMLAANNILKPQDGRPVVAPTQDMVIGCYYLTAMREGAKGEGALYGSQNEAVLAYQTGQASLQAKCTIRVCKTIDGIQHVKRIDTTIGRWLFNEAIPQDLGFVDRSRKENLLALEIADVVDKKVLGNIVDRCYRVHGATRTSQVLDRIKRLGFNYSTKGAVTVGFMDVHVPEEKPKLIAGAEEGIRSITSKYNKGLLTEEERYRSVLAVWEKTTNDMTEKLKELKVKEPFNPINMMADSGARGSMQQIRQLAGMRGLMKDTSGRTIEMPIRANFREGLTVLEFFISSHGARKGLADTALRTAESGYLTRRLVDVAQDVIVREDDCFAQRNKAVKGMWVSGIVDDRAELEGLFERIDGRVSVQDVFHPQTGEKLAGANEIITSAQARAIVKAGVDRVQIRTVFTCSSEHGVCRKCYGANMASGDLVDVGEAVGIVAAQAIGEPGTQLTMRTFHTGGVASSGDITQGLPRVEEIFEARNPKGGAVITEIPGIVEVKESKKLREVIITDSVDNRVETYMMPYASKLRVRTGDVVESGDSLMEGPVNLSDILRLKGPKDVQAYMLKEVQKVYRMQGVEISDKHIEVIIRQMLRKVQIEESGDTSMLPGELVDMFRFERENLEVIEKGGAWATAKPKLLGITKAALATESFLSAASFQETTRVLTDAAIKGKVDPLVGLKENVIIGKLIPAGVGMKRYKNIEVREVGDTSDDLLFVDEILP